MSHTDHKHDGNTTCPGCEFGPFTRNNYFTGKLMVERDFTDEARYHSDKLRLHHQRLHGWGVVCGLKVKQHESPDCRAKYVCIEPGTAVDCCGHEIVVPEEDCIDITQLDAWKDLKKKEEGAKEPGSYTLQICLKFRECPTENVPVLFDECGCDDTKCAPNRILESYDVGLIVVVDPKKTHEEQIDCKDIPWRHLEGCPHCGSPNCIVIATIAKYHFNDSLQNMPTDAKDTKNDPTNKIARIDNKTGRRLLPSSQTLYEMIECVIKHGGGGDKGEQGIQGIQGIQGKPGDPGLPGEKGSDGAGLEKGLTRINAISWKHGRASKLFQIGNQFGLIIAFTKEIQTTSIDKHVFEVSTLHQSEDEAKRGFRCWCSIVGEIVPVNLKDDGSGLIIKAEKLPPDSAAKGIAFLVDDKLRDLLSGDKRELWVRLRGDFVVDTEGRAIDAEFVRAEFPTGNRPDSAGKTPPTDLGVQGGLFESWFTVEH